MMEAQVKQGVPEYKNTQEAIKKDNELKQMETALAHKMHGRLSKVSKFDNSAFGPYPGYYEDQHALQAFHDLVLAFEIRYNLTTLV